MITIELNDGCSLKVDEQIILNSTIESVFKDSLQYSKYDECIQLDMNFNEFSCIWMCHMLNKIEQPTSIDEMRWRYLGLEPPKYTQEDYIKYFTQNLIIDGKFTSRSNDKIIAHTQRLVKLNDKFNKYMPIIYDHHLYLTISYNEAYYINEDFQTIIWIYDRGNNGKCGYFRKTSINGDTTKPYTHKYRKEFDKLLADIKSLKPLKMANCPEDLGNFKEDKRLEGAFLKQFDYNEKMIFIHI
jgi:hypothetical protein